MPLNPNGKIDKPALPFPDTAQLASGGPRTESSPVTATEEAMRAIWSRILANAPSPIPLDDNFFDLGGHSILATRLIFEIRKSFVVQAPLGLVFDKPTIKDLAAAVDDIRNADLGFAYKDSEKGGPPSPTTTSSSGAGGRLDYSHDYEALLTKLRPSYDGVPSDYTSCPVTVFLTGATGFLGAFILRDLLEQGDTVAKVICLVRASNADKALSRLRESASGRGVWDERWVEMGRLEVVKGDLDQESFGLDQSTWQRVVEIG